VEGLPLASVERGYIDRRLRSLTGQKMKISAQKVPSFSAGNALKEAV
jgi:nucleoid DNA-binding protein